MTKLVFKSKSRDLDDRYPAWIADIGDDAEAVIEQRGEESFTVWFQGGHGPYTWDEAIDEEFPTWEAATAAVSRWVDEHTEEESV